MNRRQDRASLTGFISRWWYVAERVSAALAAPRTDVAMADRTVEALLRESWLWRCAESFSARIGAAWCESRCRRVVRSIAGARAEHAERHRA
jgi:hypothetical protein